MSKNIKKFFSRGVSTALAFFIIILLAAAVGVGAWYLREKRIPEIDPMSTFTPSATTSEALDELETFTTGLRKTIETHCKDMKIFERKYVEEYEGFSWINKNNEAELIKGYELYTFRDYEELVIENCYDNIMIYLENSLTPDTENTDSEIFGFERDNIKCVFRNNPHDFYSFELSCGDATKSTTPEVYREIYNFLNPDMDLSNPISSLEVVGNFAIAYVPYYGFLLKKIGDEWIELDKLGEADVECEIVFEHEIPASLINNTCMFYKTTREVWRYNEELDKWERWYHIDFPWEKEQF
jgi:hypothetical protein